MFFSEHCKRLTNNQDQISEGETGEVPLALTGQSPRRRHTWSFYRTILAQCELVAVRKILKLVIKVQ